MKTAAYLFFTLFSLNLIAQTEADSIGMPAWQDFTTAQAEILQSRADSLYRSRQFDASKTAFDSLRLFFKHKQNWKKYFAAVTNIADCHSGKVDLGGTEFMDEQVAYALQVVPDNDTILGEVYFSAALLYMITKNADVTIDYADKAIPHLLKSKPKNDRKVILSFLSKARMYTVRQQYDEALEECRKAKEILLSVEEESEMAPNMLYNLHLTVGDILSNLFRYNEALSEYKAAFKISKILNSQVETATTYQLMGTMYLYLRDIDQAIRHFHLAESYAEELFGENHINMTISYNMLGAAYGYTDMEKSSYYYEKAIAIYKKIFGKEDGVYRLNYAINYGRHLRWEEGYPHILQAREILEAEEAQYSKVKLELYNELTSYHLNYTENQDSLLYYLELQRDQETNSGRSAEVTEMHLNSLDAEIMLAKDSLMQALEYAEASLQANYKLGLPSSGSSSQKAVSRSWYNSRIAEACYRNKADIYYGLWERDKSNKDYKRLCIENINTSFEFFDYFETDNFSGYAPKNFLPHFQVVQEFAEFYFHDKQKEDFTRFFAWQERIKSRQLQSLYNFGSKGTADVPVEIFAEEKKLNQEIFETQTRLENAVENQDSVTVAQIRGTELFNLNRKKRNLRDSLKRFYPRYFNLRYDEATVEVGVLQGLLAEDEVLLNYNHIANHRTGYCSVVKKDATEIVRFSIDKDFRTQVNDFKKLLQSPVLARKTKREQFIKISQKLYQQIIAPVENEIAGKKRIIVIGEGLIHYIPFEILLKSNANKSFAELDYLINEFEISYHYSAVLFAQNRKREVEYATGLLAFAPVFDDKLSSDYSARLTAARDTTLRAVKADGEYTPLIYSQKEVEAISAMVRKQTKT